ncbi:MAG: metal ABC transporter permease, partial [Deltaproteobacteria bacterium]|nr:metal ABC transporter permease [Deltaproteobacteria bacterium]
MTLALEFLWIPFLACLVLTGIHVYLGLHVLARGIIFVDLALAQVAALGITIALLAGHPIQSEAAFWYALAFTLGGSLLFAVTRTHRAPIPQEAIIGIVYAVSAAIAVLVVDRAPQGSEHIKQLLVGSILTVTLKEIGMLALLYGIVGAFHWAIRQPLLEISFHPDAALNKGRWVRWWDFVFYASFGFVVTSSVQIAGVLLVFSYLIVPAAIAALLTQSVIKRLALGWGLGFVVSILGLLASATWDLPTGATVVATFGVLIAAVAAWLGLHSLVRGVRAQGPRALTGVGIAAFAVAGVAGLLLLIFPRVDHHWLNWLEG